MDLHDYRDVARNYDRYLDVMYAEHDSYEGFQNFYLELAEEYGQGGVIDIACGTGAVLLWGFALRGRQRWFSLRAMQGTLLTLLAAVTVLAVVAVIDFDALFILFHKVAFTNDLWLLDPRTDMLIRLMPTDFFVTYAAIIGCLWLLGMVGLLVISAIPSAKQKKGSEIP